MPADQQVDPSFFSKLSPEVQAGLASGEIDETKVQEYRDFLQEVESKFMRHRVIVENQYCEWFAQGRMPMQHVRHFIVQFSVFSNLFLIAQLKKMINAGSLEGMRSSKEILANEIGVIFNKGGHSNSAIRNDMSAEEKDVSGDPELVSTAGTVNGGTFKFKAAHFEWLLRMGEPLDLTFNDMGKRRHGTASTLFFCHELERLYGSEDPSIAEGASYAVEHWAAAGFWKQLIEGLQIFKAREIPNLSLAFFTWHDKVEDQHAQHTSNELEKAFFSHWFERDKFISGGLKMLDGVAAFWDGLDKDRKSLAAA